MSYGSNISSSGGGGGGGGSDVSEVMTILVLGKAGNGKSSLCNAILGDKRFPEGRGMATTTRTAQSETTIRGNKRLKVVDTPDVTNCGMDAQRRREEVAKWRQLTLSRPSAVLLAVRCDVRYTAEEYAIYREMMDLWGDNSLKARLVVAFTFGDRQDSDLGEELRTVCSELKSVLRDAGNQYVLFDKTNEESRNGITFDIVSAMERRKRSGHSSAAAADRGGRGTSKTYPHTATPTSSGLPVSSRTATMVLAAVVSIMVILTIVFAIVNMTAAAIGCGVVGLVLAMGLVVMVCKGNQGMNV